MKDLIWQFMNEIMIDFGASISIRMATIEESGESRKPHYFVTAVDRYGIPSQYARTDNVETTLRLIRADLRNSGGSF